VTEATRTADGAAGPSVDVEAVGARIAANIGRVIQGKDDVVQLALTVLLAEGHLLIEDVPGVGKTTLAKALAASVDASVRRIQFTPDLLPSDVTGVAIYDQETREFEFKPGAVFANIVVADEINRASPKTQSALLEAMEERQVTVDGVSYELARPFLVMATQNPLEMEGTYPLPEAQRDRFTARVSMGYPNRDAELAMLDDRATSDPLTSLAPVADAATVRDLVDAVGGLFVSEAVRRYVVGLVEASRRSAHLRLGASPRAGAAAAGRPRVGRPLRTRPRPARRRPGPGGAGTGPSPAPDRRRRPWPAQRGAGRHGAARRRTGPARALIRCPPGWCSRP
jgi:MoxR-like ATPase